MRDPHLESQHRLKHIVDAILTIEKYVMNVDVDHFVKDSMLHDAVLFQFTVIGEAIIHIETEKLNRYPYPWYKVRSFRNLIAHEYFNIKLSAVWQIIEADLPKLKETILQMLNNEFE